MPASASWEKRFRPKIFPRRASDLFLIVKICHRGFNPATHAQWEAYGPEGQQRVLDSLHTRRLGAPEDIASAALFLASEQARWISGQILSVDGGRL